MSDAECEEARRQVYAGLRVLERHGERHVLLRRERLEGLAQRYMDRLEGMTYGGSWEPDHVHVSSMIHAKRQTLELIREADEEAERYGC